MLGTVWKALCVLTHLVLITTLQGGYYSYHPLFNEGSEAG